MVLPLSTAFLASWHAHSLEPSDQLEMLLLDAVEAGRRAWPGVVLADEVFVAHLGEKSCERGGPGEALNALRLADLFLACACVHGDRTAIQTIECHYLSKAKPGLVRLGLADARLTDTLQGIRCKLLVPGPDGRPPAIARYAGLGRLQAWIAVVATREALNMILRAKPDRPTQDDPIAILASSTTDPEMKCARAEYRGEFEASLREAVNTLSCRDLHILQLHYLEGLTTTEIGKVYRVHQTTASQWLARARARVAERTKQCLKKRVALDASAWDSMVRVVQSGLDVSISSLLGKLHASS
jgi:RNA polymerase sigma-70 factor (ECF subfamily)